MLTTANIETLNSRNLSKVVRNVLTLSSGLRLFVGIFDNAFLAALFNLLWKNTQVKIIRNQPT